MDSTGEEVSLWQKMQQYPGSWAEGTLQLRSSMVKQNLGVWIPIFICRCNPGQSKSKEAKQPQGEIANLMCVHAFVLTYISADLILLASVTQMCSSL